MSQPRGISAAALRKYLEGKPHGEIKRLHALLQSRVARCASVAAVHMWLQRDSIPHKYLFPLADILGVDPRALQDPHGAPPGVRAPRAARYRPAGELTREENELIYHYRRASTAWQAGLRKLARMHPDHQKPDMRESVLALLDMITAEPVPDSRLGKEWKRPDRR